MLENENVKLENNGEETMPRETVEIVGVSFRNAGKIYYFSPAGKNISEGDRVIVDTSRGIEIGTVKVKNKKVDASTVVQPLKAIIRTATPDDILRDEKNRELELDAAVICKRKIQNHKLEMSLVASEYTFDNSKLIFYFTCESRVDFRELVKDLASTFHTRIELRQIGIRDEAKMMGGLGTCGRVYCCSGFLTDFVQVSIKMAKEQNFSLNSAKVSGACGRLMCCLKYEHETYEDALRRLPPVNSVVKTKDGVGTVTELRALKLEMKVRLDGDDKDNLRVYPLDEVKILKTPGKKDKKEDEETAE